MHLKAVLPFSEALMGLNGEKPNEVQQRILHL